jgi:hypothetical protein
MSLLHPTPGMIIDRISILNLKIDAYLKADRRTNALEEELMELEAFLDSQGKDSREIDKLRNSLYACNRSIWDRENELRSMPCRGQTDEWNLSALKKLAKCAVEIAKINDERVNLMRKIDVEFGSEHLVEEKVYGLR